MATKPVLKTVSANDFPETDPITELSRIMGLTKDDAADDASLEIDLEQELMGEFAREDQASVAGDVDLSLLDAELDDAFSDLVMEEEAPQAVAGDDAPPMDLQAREAVIEADLAQLDAAFQDLDLSIDEDVAVEAPAVEAQTSEVDAAEAFETFDLAVEQEPPADAREDFVAAAPSTFEEQFRSPSVQSEQAEPVAKAEPVAQAEPVGEPVAAAPVAAVAAPAAAPATSLEDELRALLGRVNAPSSVRAPTPANDGAPGEPLLTSARRAEEAQPAVEKDAEAPAATAAEAHEDVAAADRDLPGFDDFSFDDVDFENAALASALEETLAADDQLHAAAEAEYAKHIARQEDAAALNSREPAEEIEVVDDFSIDLEAEMSTIDDVEAEAEPMKPQETEVPVAARPSHPLTFTEERRAAAAAEAAASAQQAPFDWRRRFSEMKEADQQPKPAAKAPEPVEPDPFAALAALAAQPSSVHSYGRATPVASAPAPRAPVVPAEPAKPTAPAMSSWRARDAEAASTAASSTARTPTSERPYAETLRSVQPAAARAESAAPNLRSSLPAGFAAASSAFAPREAAASAPSVSKGVDEFDDFDLAGILDDTNLAPEIETVDLADKVSLADELDIPDFAPEEPVARSTAFDDLDADFADAFQQLSLNQPARGAQPAPRSEPASSYFARTAEPARASYPQATAGSAEARAPYEEPDPFQVPADSAFDPIDDDFDRPVQSGAMQALLPERRWLVLAAAVAGVAIVAGLGIWAIGGDSSGDAPALVKADTAPVKVKPETPGGVVVPNQTGQVYDQVRGKPAAALSQEKLVTAAEEPMPTVPPAAAAVPAAPEAVAPAAPVADGGDSLPGVVEEPVKSEARVTPEETAQNSGTSQDVAAITPRRVRTMIVRPDGTLVPREDPPANAAPVTDTAEPQGAMPAGADPQTMTNVQTSQQIPSAVPGAADDVSILPAETADEPASSLATPAPSEVIVPMPRPTRDASPAAAEPMREIAAAAPPVRTQTAPEPAASVQPASAPAATAPAGGSVWTVQIASQPTREGAQATYEDMASRYGSVLGGKGVNIVQAEVAGKGTMWRVRVPAASKADANILCAKLKTAGGSCFVTQ